MKLPTIEVFNSSNQDKEITVVRDDLPFPFPSPNFSKIRGLEIKLKKLSEEGITNIAVQDTIISRCGWGTSYIAKKHGMKVYNFYSQRKNGIDFYRKMSESFGATTIPVMGTHQRIAMGIDKQWLKQNNIDDAVFMPIGLNLPETITEHISLIKKLPAKVFEGTVVVCVSSGTIISGIIAGIKECGYTTEVIGVQIHKWVNRESTISDKIFNVTGKQVFGHGKNRSLIADYPNLSFVVVDAGFTYNQTVKESPPFPCDMFLDRKAWHHLNQFYDKLKKPVTFWNIGGEWNPDTGISDELRGDGIVTKPDIIKHLEQNEVNI